MSRTSDASHATGRVVRWDAPEGVGAVVAHGVPSEIAVSADVVDDVEGWDVEVGDLVAVAYVSGEHGLRATSLRRADGEE
ncbi:hypothetical protein [Motilibacter peucedani]|nr:hypothetical protein [Motilibacter peucedani]